MLKMDLVNLKDKCDPCLNIAEVLELMITGTGSVLWVRVELVTSVPQCRPPVSNKMLFFVDASLEISYLH